MRTARPLCEGRCRVIVLLSYSFLGHIVLNTIYRYVSRTMVVIKKFCYKAMREYFTEYITVYS